MKSLNYYVGTFLQKLGYRIVKTHEYPVSTLNPLDLSHELLSKLNRKESWIIQIGAFDGVLADPLEKILNKTNSQVLLIEPQSEPFNSLSRRYANFKNIFLEQLVIGKTDGVCSLYIPNSSLADPKASLMSNHHKRFGVNSNNVRKIEVESISVGSLLQKYQIDIIDILQVDTEGFDYEIIKQFFDAKIYPLIINCETKHLNANDRNAIRTAFKNHDYLYLDSEYDTFAIKWSEYLRIATGDL